MGDDRPIKVEFTEEEARELVTYIEEGEVIPEAGYRGLEKLRKALAVEE